VIARGLHAALSPHVACCVTIDRWVERGLSLPAWQEAIAVCAGAYTKTLYGPGLTEGDLSPHDTGFRLNDIPMSALGKPRGDQKPREAFKALADDCGSNESCEK
jgi:hypothetical protein